MATTQPTWSPASWRERPALHQPDWPDPVAAEAARERLTAMPPLVFAGEARRLRESLAQVAAGRAFLLQAGDCAESFHDFSAVSIREKLKVILQMAAVLTYGSMLPVVKLGRIAGQFVRPRSSPIELVDGIELPSFCGHMVHGDEPNAAARVFDPARMVQGYHQSASTLNLLRAFTKGGFADLTKVHLWNQEFVASSPEGRRYEAIALEIERALRFMAACGIDLEGERPVVWVCDPMHANIFKTESGYKTRRFEDILSEIQGFFAACLSEGAWPGGVHLEFTGEHVTECLGGSEEVLEDHLDRNYATLCDPRLNARQSLDLAFRVAELMRAAEERGAPH